MNVTQIECCKFLYTVRKYQQKSLTTGCPLKYIMEALLGILLFTGYIVECEVLKRNLEAQKNGNLLKRLKNDLKQVGIKIENIIPDSVQILQESIARWTTLFALKSKLICFANWLDNSVDRKPILLKLRCEKFSSGHHVEETFRPPVDVRADQKYGGVVCHPLDQSAKLLCVPLLTKSSPQKVNRRVKSPNDTKLEIDFSEPSENELQQANEQTTVETSTTGTLWGLIPDKDKLTQQISNTVTNSSISNYIKTIFTG